MEISAMSIRKNKFLNELEWLMNLLGKIGKKLQANHEKFGLNQRDVNKWQLWD